MSNQTRKEVDKAPAAEGDRQDGGAGLATALIMEGKVASSDVSPDLRVSEGRREELFKAEQEKREYLTELAQSLSLVMSGSIRRELSPESVGELIRRAPEVTSAGGEQVTVESTLNELAGKLKLAAKTETPEESKKDVLAEARAVIGQVVANDQAGLGTVVVGGAVSLAEAPRSFNVQRDIDGADRIKTLAAGYVVEVAHRGVDSQGRAIADPDALFSAKSLQGNTDFVSAALSDIRAQAALRMRELAKARGLENTAMPSIGKAA